MVNQILACLTPQLAAKCDLDAATLLPPWRQLRLTSLDTSRRLCSGLSRDVRTSYTCSIPSPSPGQALQFASFYTLQVAHHFIMFQSQLVTMFLLWLTIWIRATSTASLYAYSTAKGVQVGAQDPKTGELHYSNCNSEKTPIFPIDKLNVLKVGLKSRKITALAAAGWWDGQKVTVSCFLDLYLTLTDMKGIHSLPNRRVRHRQRVL
jgi:hypothetical protein